MGDKYFDRWQFPVTETAQIPREFKQNTRPEENGVFLDGECI